jgi:DNA-binding NarL/FixJ family response regulator
MTNFQLLSIGNDPIFRLGLRIACQDYPDLQIFAEVSTPAEALVLLEGRSSANGGASPADLVIFDFDTPRVRSGEVSEVGEMSAIAFCRQLASLYPELSLLLLGGPLTAESRAILQEAGVNGYCPKGRDIALTMAVIRLVASGASYWPEDVAVSWEIPLNLGGVQSTENSSTDVEKTVDYQTVTTPLYQKMLADICLSGLREIDATLAVVKAELQETKTTGNDDFGSILDGLLLSGHHRELLAARWVVSQLLPTPRRREREEIPGVQGKQRGGGRGNNLLINSELVVKNTDFLVEDSTKGGDWQGSLFDSVAAKLQFDVVNLSGVPLEIDVLRSTKKLELINCILGQLEEVLEELRFSQVQPTQLTEKMPAILRNLWADTIIDFFGRYYTLQVRENESLNEVETDLKVSNSLAETSESLGKINGIEVVPVLLSNREEVGAEIIDKIPLTVDFFAHLLFENPLIVDNNSCLAGSPEAMQRAEYLLENFVIQVASGVVQPLLNNFGNVEEVKQKFYDGKLISTREIERFRNNLSWKYRWESYFVEPKAIFESRFWLFVLRDSGIQRVCIYAPRNMELARLSGWQLALTLVLEARDAIAPRLRAVVSLFGVGVVYVLTEVVGRGIGLVGRGVIQGIGNSLQDSKFGKNG